MSEITLLAGNANIQLAREISRQLQTPLCDVTVERFSDGEIYVQVNENVRGRDAFIIQSTCQPVNDHLMELILMADALRRASVEHITAVIPYFGYARQDRRVRSARVPISAKVAADMIAAVGINHVITVDLHADQIQGFFDMPVDNVYATPVTFADIYAKNFDNLMVVSPDVGGVVRARAIAKRLNDADLAIIDKRRSKTHAKTNEVHMTVIGDVAGRDCIIVDDIVDTAGTLCKAVDILKAEGARSVTAYATHPVLSGRAIENIEASQLDELVVTDTIPLNEKAQQCKKIRQLSMAELFAQIIVRINGRGSVSSMFD
jgi:ribose-phosphate pyrophosphokinase